MGLLRYFVVFASLSLSDINLVIAHFAKLYVKYHVFHVLRKSVHNIVKRSIQEFSLISSERVYEKLYEVCELR